MPPKGKSKGGGKGGLTKSASQTGATTPRTPTGSAPSQKDQKEAATAFAKAAVETYRKDIGPGGYKNNKFSPNAIDKIWEFCDEKNKGHLSIKPDFVKWLQKIGVAPMHGKALLAMFEIAG